MQRPRSVGPRQGWERRGGERPGRERLAAGRERLRRAAMEIARLSWPARRHLAATATDPWSLRALADCADERLEGVLAANPALPGSAARRLVDRRGIPQLPDLAGHPGLAPRQIAQCIGELEGMIDEYGYAHAQDAEMIRRLIRHPRCPDEALLAQVTMHGDAARIAWGRERLRGGMLDHPDWEVRVAVAQLPGLDAEVQWRLLHSPVPLAEGVDEEGERVRGAQRVRRALIANPALDPAVVRWILEEGDDESRRWLLDSPVLTPEQADLVAPLVVLEPFECERFAQRLLRWGVERDERERTRRGWQMMEDSMGSARMMAETWLALGARGREHLGPEVAARLLATVDREWRLRVMQVAAGAPDPGPRRRTGDDDLPF